MTDIALATPTPSTDVTARRAVSGRTKSVMFGLLAVVVLGGATTALFALEACAEPSPGQPTTAPTTTTSASVKPSATPPAPSPTPPLPPPPT